MSTKKTSVTEQSKKEKISMQIEIEQKTISYDMKEYTIELYVSKYLKQIDEDENELFGTINTNLGLSKAYSLDYLFHFYFLLK